MSQSYTNWSGLCLAKHITIKESRNEENGNIERDVHITIDIPVARKMLVAAGWSYNEIYSVFDIDIFEKVLEQIDCYGATFEIGGK